jgi:putative ABC transport system permease protein
MLGDDIRYVVKHLFRRKLRSWLTLLGIFIGMAAVVALISLSEGLQGAITDQFSSIGADRIMVQPAGAVAGPFSAGISEAKLSDADVDVIEQVRGVEFTKGFIAKSVPVRFKGEQGTGFIIGIPSDSATTQQLQQVGFWDLQEGRNPRPGAKYEAAIGSSVANGYFSKNVSIRNKIELVGMEFTVVGIGKSSGSFSDVGIRIPKDTAKEIFSTEDVAMIVVKVAAGFDPLIVAENIKKELSRFRNVKQGEEDFTVETANQIIESYLQILGIVQVLIVGVAAISLIVGGVGIMNTMYTAVVERTREIGIMKAIGARNRRILRIFIIESGILGIVGGGIGAGLGVAIAKSVEAIAGAALGSNIIQAQVSFGLVALVLTFSFSLGAIAGYFPAKQASRMQPVDALRH